jgi:hypothetical protein
MEENSEAIILSCQNVQVEWMFFENLIVIGFFAIVRIFDLKG